MATETFKLTGKIVVKTTKAILFATYPADLGVSLTEFSQMIKDKSKDINMEWIPFSQVKQMHEDFSVVSDKQDTIVITAWIAKQKGFI